MNYSRVQNFRKNQKQHISTKAAAMLQNQMIRRSSSSDLSEICSIGSGSSLESLASLASDSGNSFSSGTPPSALKSSDHPPKIPFQKQKAALGNKKMGKPGFLSLLADKEVRPFQNKHIILSYRLQHYERPSGVSLPIETKTTSEKSGDEIPEASNPDDKPLKNPTSKNGQGPIQFGTSQGLKFRHESPCVFALRSWEQSSAPPQSVFSDYDLFSRPESAPSSEIKGHAIINPEGNACFRPLTFCTVHKSAGVLRLKDIQDSECYSRLEVKIPVHKVTHWFNDCILKFPPIHTTLIVFKPPSKDQKAMEDFSSVAPPPPPPPPPLKANPNASWTKNAKLQVNFLRGDAWFCSEECRQSSAIKDLELEAIQELALMLQRAKIKQANRAKAVKESEVASGKDKNKGKGKGIFFIG
ncbi:uncharacterized protein [Coffea arabica]|uniref:Uncharacterized protein isoform X2 n=1 Tax=Coffea arabica TaxID=13443 RepID=A0ABM4U7H1_COFAR